MSTKLSTHQMPYLVIQKMPVFLTNQRNAYLKDRLQLKTSYSSDPKIEKENDTKVYEFLNDLYKSNKKSFISEWVDFNLNTCEASFEVWFLLYDYCDLLGIGELLDVRDEQTKTYDQYLGAPLQQPMGKYFVLNFPASSGLFSFKKTSIKFLIEINRIISVSGRLDRFTIFQDNIKMQFSKDISFSNMPLIEPPLKAPA